MNSGVKRLVNSSAAIVLALAVIGAVVMNVAGRIEGETALKFIQWLVVAFFGKIAFEDSAAKLARMRARPSDPGDHDR